MPLAIAGGDVPQGADGGLSRLNSQATTFEFGQIFIHAISGAILGIAKGWPFRGDAEAALVPIWPISHDRIVRPPEIALDDHLADYITGAFFNFSVEDGRPQSD